jgi:hypothetical protein
MEKAVNLFNSTGSVGKAAVTIYGASIAIGAFIGGVYGWFEFMDKPMRRRQIKSAKLKRFEGVYNASVTASSFVGEVVGGALVSAGTVAVSPIVVPYLALTERSS